MVETVKNDLEKAVANTEYEKKWILNTAEANVGDRRQCVNCNHVMLLLDDSFAHWKCKNCNRIEFLCTHEEDRELEHYYWLIEEGEEQTPESKKYKFWT